MSTSQATITLTGLTPLEIKELQEALADAGESDASVQVGQDPSAVGGAKKGEPFTMFVIVAISQIALTALSIYLAKSRSQSTSTETITITKANGDKLEYKLDIAHRQEDAVKADLMKQIGQLKIPTDGLAGS